MSDYLVPIGLFKKTKKYVAGHISLTKIFKQILRKLNVTFSDPCCLEENSTTEQNGYPVKFNPTLQRLEWFNGTAWVDIAGIVETTTTTTSSSTTTTTTLG